MERAWGAPRSPSSSETVYVSDVHPAYAVSSATAAENENIAFDWAYIQYDSPVGTFAVDYQSELAWGTVFGDNAINGTSVPKIGWSMQFGGLTTMAQIVKVLDGSRTAKMPTSQTDQDNDKYILAAIYNWRGGDTGLLYSFPRTAAQRPGGLMDYQEYDADRVIVG